VPLGLLDHVGEPAMSSTKQVLGHELAAVLVAGRDRGEVPAVDVDDQRRQVAAQQPLGDLLLQADAHDDQPVQPLAEREGREQRRRLRRGRLLGVDGDLHRVALELLHDPGQPAQVGRVAREGRDHPDPAQGLARAADGLRPRDEAEVVGDRQHAVARARVHTLRAVERQGDGGDADPGLGRDIVDGDVVGHGGRATLPPYPLHLQESKCFDERT
jgi:hypothetical protein